MLREREIIDQEGAYGSWEVRMKESGEEKEGE